MKTLFIKETKTTPEVLFNGTSGMLQIKGRAIDLDMDKFWFNIFNFIERYTKKPVNSTNIIIELEYFNSNSVKMLLKFLKTGTVIENKGKKLTISWKYDSLDQDMKEIIEDIEKVSGLTIKKIPVNFNHRNVA